MIPLLFTLAAHAGGLGSRVFVVERASGSLAVYDVADHAVVGRIDGFGNLAHATMTFSPDLRWGYVATRSGQLSRVDLATLQRAGDVAVSHNSIDVAITSDGRYVATAEYDPGGVTLLDAQTLAVAHRVVGPAGPDGKPTRMTGIVDAPGGRLVFVGMEVPEVWVLDAAKPGFPVAARVPVAANPYDAMITPDGRFYVVGHLDSPVVSVVDLDHPEAGARRVSLGGPETLSVPVKLPHLASWAVAQDHVFVPLPGEARLAVLDKDSFEVEASVPLRGNPVYAVRHPSGREIWVSFSGEEDDAWVQVIDAETLEVTREVRVGRRVYHLDFTPRGAALLASANADGQLLVIDAATLQTIDVEPLASPSGIFGPWRAFQAGL